MNKKGQKPLFSNMADAHPAGDAVLCAVAVDAEEDFDWQNPVSSTDYSTACMSRIPQLQEITGAYGAVPTYLLTYPVLGNDEVIRLLQRHIARGDCEFGAQLHPWVNPPFDGDSGSAMSYAGNLQANLEERKLVMLMRRLEECFGEAPTCYRAGRYGLSRTTSLLLEKHGFLVDTSLAPRTTSVADGGPDYTSVDYQPFWFGENRRLLELPLCRSIVGWGGNAAAPIYHAMAAGGAATLRLPGVLNRLGVAERITLSPEGNDLPAMIRLVRRLLARGQRIFVVSFHSSSLALGRNPYVQTKAELHQFYDRLSGILDFIAGLPQARFVSLSQMPGYMAAADAGTRLMEAA